MPPVKIPQEDHDRFFSLFNGKNTDAWKGWVTQNSDIWHIEDGAIVARGASLRLQPSLKTEQFFSYFYTKKNTYEDFKLKLEARVNDGGIFGVCFRASHEIGQNPHCTNGYEVRINCSRKNVNITGTLLYTRGDRETVDDTIDELTVPAGKWFPLEITALGNNIIVAVDDDDVVSHFEPERRPSVGHIALHLLGAGTVAEFRSIEIKEYPREPENKKKFGAKSRNKGG